MKRYRGKYRVLIERDDYGDPLENGFTYLKCNKNNRGGKIYRYDDKYLVAYVNSSITGKNMVKKILEKDLYASVVYYDGECDITFLESDIDKLARIFNISVLGKDMIYSSIENHPRKDEIRKNKRNNYSDEYIERMRKQLEHMKNYSK